VPKYGGPTRRLRAGAALAAVAADGTVAINFAVASRGAGAVSLVLARLPPGDAPVAGCLEVT
jgi:hypothetical protein